MPDSFAPTSPSPGHPVVRGLIHEINNANNLGMLNASLLQRVWNDLSPLLAALGDRHPELSPGNIPLPLLLEEIPAMLKAQEDAAERIRIAVRSVRELDLVPRPGP